MDKGKGGFRDLLSVVDSVVSNMTRWEVPASQDQGLTRRSFLKVAGSAIGMGCALDSRALSLRAKRLGNRDLDGEFIYGTHFYHPQSGPRPDQFRPMLEAISKKFRFNIIQVWSNWDYYNPTENEFRFDDLNQLLALCDELNIRVLLTVMLESAPYWLERAHPETRYVNAGGEAIHLGGSGAHYTGGYPGLCFDWQCVRDAAGHFVRELIKTVAPHQCIYGYDVWNEPAIVDLEGRELSSETRLSEKLFCYCPGTTKEFQAWLRRRYETIDRLNQAWIRRYPDWDSIDPPRRAMETYADWLDWRHFIQDRTTDYLRFRTEAVRAIDPKRILEAHVAYTPPCGPVTLRGIQPHRLAEIVDVFGCSFYPSGFGIPIERAVGEFDFVRSCASDGEFWITELQGGGYAGAPMPPSALRTWNWLGIDSGAKAIIYWTYLTEGTGIEASSFGLVTRSGESTERADEAARTNRLIQERWGLINGYRPQAEVAILFDQDNALLTFASAANEEPSTQSVAGYCKALWALDLRAEFVEPPKLNQCSCRVLLVPWYLIGKKETCDAIVAFAKRGGTVILEGGFGRFDERYYFNSVIPPNGLDATFGYREVDSFTVEHGLLPSDAVNQATPETNSLEAILRFSEPETVDIKADTHLIPINVKTAVPIAKCNQWTVAAKVKIDTGTVYYIGTNFGGSLATGGQGGLSLLRAMIGGVVQPEVTSSSQLRPRLIRGDKGSLLSVFNTTDAEVAGSVVLKPGFKRAMDIYTGAHREIITNQMEITVPRKDVAVFDLS